MPHKKSASRVDSPGLRISRRALLQAAGATTVGLLGAQAALAGAGRPPGAVPTTADALGQDAIDTLAGELDYDLETIFRYVTDEIWYEPYAGSLRGAGGTLESRAGNSVDKAALLAALLQSALVETRFVSGHLDDASATAIVEGSSVARDAARARAQSIMTGTPEGNVSPAPSTPAGLPAELQSVADRQDELVAAAESWAADHLDSGVATDRGGTRGSGHRHRQPTGCHASSWSATATSGSRRSRAPSGSTSTRPSRAQRSARHPRRPTAIPSAPSRTTSGTKCGSR